MENAGGTVFFKYSRVPNLADLRNWQFCCLWWDDYYSARFMSLYFFGKYSKHKKKYLYGLLDKVILND